MLEKYMREGAFIEVNLGEIRNISELEYLISVFVKFDALKEDNEKVEEFLDFKESVIDMLQDEAVYIGMRVIDGWSEFYFYSKESKGIEQKVASIFRESGYAYEISITKDSRWDFYYNNLFPTDLEMYLIYSKKSVLQMMAEGDDLLKPREVEHYVSFDTESQKDRFVSEVEKIGFAYKDEIDSKELPHAVALAKVHALDQDSLEKNIGELLKLIKKDHGHYELWSAPLAD
ncbi:Putative cytoplasmic protein [hydrothermal vent metagenome]|uniref:Putative cytoplasmic protein n=1 Tax=hydrothermal vent metagenome TaxID=652676 RepID=A0A1W1B8G7_9ZZZZ